jgi:phosphate:Na+ symporter
MNSAAIPWLEVLPFLMAGLAIFLYGATLLSDELEAIGKTKADNILHKFTKKPWSAFLSGLGLTTLLDSSSLVIILLITAVNAGLVKVFSAFFVVLGSNIGTTVGSQIIALDVGKWSWVLLLIGVIIILSKKEKLRGTGYILTGIGLILFGLFLVDEATRPLREHESVVSWLKNLDNPIYGALAGGLVTLIIQSSSATVGIAIILCGQGLISLEAGIAVMMGVEIGTCSDTLLVTLGKNKAAVKVGVFHLIFNIASVIVGVLLVNQFADLTIWISGSETQKQMLANAHLLFNLMGTIVAVPILLLFFRPKEKEIAGNN